MHWLRLVRYHGLSVCSSSFYLSLVHANLFSLALINYTVEFVIILAVAHDEQKLVVGIIGEHVIGGC